MSKAQIKGWVVVMDSKSLKTIPVNQKFFMSHACAECLRNEMNTKKALDPATHIYPYKLVSATLTMGK